MTATAPGWRRRSAARAFAVLSVLFGVSAAAASPPRVAEPPQKVRIDARPLEVFDPRDSRRRFGALEFRGGLVLSSPYAEFGGLSAFRLARDGQRFLALTDDGRWLRGRLVHDGQRPIGITDAEMAPILGPSGQPLGARRWHDTEAIAEDGGTIYVGIERVNQILRFDFGRHGFTARGQPIPVPPGVKRLPYNAGLEALVFVPKGLPLAGTLIAISERGLDEAGQLKAFLIGGPVPGEFAIRRSDDFDITDAALLPGGDLLVLERRFSIMRGVAMRIRRIALAAIKPGALVDGPVLILADMGYQIDNMEGLAVHRSGGETVLTIVSDDNFSPLQRTLLLQFTLVED